MFQSILANLLCVAVGFGIFALCVLANIAASLFYNIAKLKQPFSFKRFIEGLLKMLAIGLATALLAIVATLVPFMLQQMGITIPDGIETTYTVAAIFVLYFNLVKKYFLEAYNTVKNIMENENVLAEAGEEKTTEANSSG